MKKIKLVLSIVLFGAMGFGAFTAYEHYTMSAEELALLENIEALTLDEPGGGGSESGAFTRYLYKNEGSSCQYEYQGKLHNGVWFICTKVDTWIFGVISNCGSVDSRSCTSKTSYNDI